MKQLNVKKLILPNIPYVFIALLATKVSEAVRLAPGSDASAKLLNITIPLRMQTDGSAVSSTPRKPPLPRRSSSLSGMRSRTGFGKTRSGAKRWYGSTTRK